MNETSPGGQVPMEAGKASVQQWVLVPHRSLGQTGFLVLMGVLCAVSFVSGVAFTLMGAWPVAGFFGLDVLLVWGAFKLNYRSGRRFELVELAPQALTVTRVRPSGRRQSETFNPYWVRVVLDEREDGRTRLCLRLHERQLTFGHFLNDDERREFAGVLAGALAEARGRRI